MTRYLTGKAFGDRRSTRSKPFDTNKREFSENSAAVDSRRNAFVSQQHDLERFFYQEPTIMSSRRPLRVSRRSLLLSTLPVMLPSALARAGEPENPLPPSFPGQDPEMVREMVTVAHGHIARVKELVGRHQTLAKASYDWGFGDWESALGAASHVGNREIAEFLLANGARPTIFSAAMLGHLDVVKAFITSSPGVQKIKGPHSITLLRHAVAGGAQAKPVLEYLTSVGGADDRLPSQPLTADDLAKLKGSYESGVEITEAREQLTFGRSGRTRGMGHLGSYEFYPVGAEHVRIRFTASPSGVTLTVHDPGVVLTAKKTA